MSTTGLPFGPIPAKTTLTVAFGFVLPLKLPLVNDKLLVVATAAAFCAQGLLVKVAVDEDEKRLHVSGNCFHLPSGGSRIFCT